MEKLFKNFEKIISAFVDLMLAFLILVMIFVMGEAIYKLTIQVIPLRSFTELSILVDGIATLFILLEVILMLLRYVKEGHHIPVRYLILISITAILREFLLAHGSGIDTFFLSGAILILVAVLFILERVKAFHDPQQKY